MSSSLVLIIKQELKARQWDYKTLAQESGVSRTLVSRVLNDKMPPSPDFVIKVAIALDANPVQWLQLANILPQNTSGVTEDDSLTRELVAVVRSLPDDKKPAALEYLQYLLTKQ